VKIKRTEDNMQKTQAPTSTTIPPAQSHSEILTVDELAAWLKVSPRAIYELSRSRSQARGKHPLPAIRIHKKMLRFRGSDIEAWLQRCAEAGRRQ
jgi:predicted DNA-binding transcriptional regulator AlpA